MAIDLYCKVLRSQESGYSGDTPDQRGKYILIPSTCWDDVFPVLSHRVFNDAAPVVFKTTSGRVAVTYVYHNAKFHLEALGLKRGHNERRLYRSRELDEALALDREVIFVVFSDDRDLYALSVQPKSEIYEKWAKLAHDCNKGIKHFRGVEALLDELGRDQVTSEFLDLLTEQSEDDLPKGFRGVVQDISKYSQTRVRPQQGEIPDQDPGAPFASLLKNQSSFSKFIYEMYGGVCALRKTSLISKSSFGLEAAHIQMYSHQGPHLPTNGILMSSDLHFAFDKGAFTLTLENRVQIHEAVPQDSQLRSFDGLLIKPSQEYLPFAPFRPYVEWHRKHLFNSDRLLYSLN